jgi:hypothetical protein
MAVGITIAHYLIRARAGREEADDSRFCLNRYRPMPSIVADFPLPPERSRVVLPDAGFSFSYNISGTPTFRLA